MHGLQFDIRRLDRDVIGNLRHGTLHLDCREGQDAAGRPDRNIALVSHRQRVVILGMRDGEIRPLRVFTQVAAHIGSDAHPVVTRHALEVQCRRGLVTVQDDIAVIVVKVEVQVADCLLVRRTGYGCHPVRMYRKVDKNASGFCALRSIFRSAALKKRHCNQYKQVFFHGRYSFYFQVIIPRAVMLWP